MKHHYGTDTNTMTGSRIKVILEHKEYKVTWLHE
jgi:hypothetical protein